MMFEQVFIYIFNVKMIFLPYHDADVCGTELLNNFANIFLLNWMVSSV